VNILNLVLWLILCFFGGCGAANVADGCDIFKRVAILVFYIGIIAWLSVVLFLLDAV
jgi:hypothetical protein